MPIFRYEQLIVTAVGTFMIGIDLDYIISVSAYIQLREYRNIDVVGNFTASLYVDIRFGYGLARIL